MTRWDAFIDGDGARTRVSQSSMASDDNVVAQTPGELLERARRVVGGISLDVYTLARVISSEYGSGKPAELLCIGDADLNKARRKGVSVHAHATGGTDRYGRQKSPRPVSSARDPYVRHVRAAQVLMQPDGARGIARGAVQYFDPKTQLALWEQGKTVHPLVILDRWTYARPWAERGRDSQGRMTAELGAPGRKSDQLVWIGSVRDVDGYELLLFRPFDTSGDTRAEEVEAELQAARFADTVEIVHTRGRVQPPPTSADLHGGDPELARAAALAGIALITRGIP